ncbi:MAG: type I methionyl aminopeptidase [Deltaproteobacteria bacterium]|nr:type I methionyl aminopeptidase [Candidatus Anaeroferrophillus wilburensis]MBN2889542.1 type I methionyl aminopeptidase [Deltaproteobacteria bacterium]
MITLRSRREIEKIRAANQIVAEVLERLREAVQPGISTLELDAITEKLIRERGGTPAFKGYAGFPASLCASVNEVIVHGIPRADIILAAGDIISLDVGAKLHGYYGDAAITVPVGEVSDAARRLMQVTEESLAEGIQAAWPGEHLFTVSARIQRYVEARGYSVVRDFVGHGIGTQLHESPQVPNFGVEGTGIRLKAGMVIAIEPMVNMGTHEVDVLADGWTAVTRDRLLSAHYEHTIAITDGGPEILSKRL